MAICSGAFPPSSTLEPFLMSYCNQHRDEKDGIGELAKYVFSNLLENTLYHFTYFMFAFQQVHHGANSERDKTRTPLRSSPFNGNFSVYAYETCLL